MSVTITQVQLETAVDACEIEDFRTDYSGRSMYGRTCLGVVVDNDAQAMRFAFALARTIVEEGDHWDDEQTVADTLDQLDDALRRIGAMHTDGMGRSIIAYFEGVTVVAA